jgi:hypothetical protein
LAPTEPLWRAPCLRRCLRRCQIPRPLWSRNFQPQGLPGQAVAVLGVHPNQQILDLQAALLAAVAPLTGTGGTAAAFVTDPGQQINAKTKDWVETFQPNQTGANYTAHLIVGMATVADLKAMQAETFDDSLVAVRLTTGTDLVVGERQALPARRRLAATSRVDFMTAPASLSVNGRVMPRSAGRAECGWQSMTALLAGARARASLSWWQVAERILNRTRSCPRGVPGGRRVPEPGPVDNGPVAEVVIDRAPSRVHGWLVGHPMVEIGAHAVGAVAIEALTVYSDRRISTFTVRGLQSIHHAVVSLVLNRISVFSDPGHHQAMPFGQRIPRGVVLRQRARIPLLGGLTRVPAHTSHHPRLRPAFTNLDASGAVPSDEHRDTADHG